MDDCFDAEEQEFLRELAEQGYEEGLKTLIAHQNEEVTIEDAESHVTMLARQNRRINFLERLRDALEADDG